MRPLSIYCYEDKLVQEALRRILEAVFEPYFKPSGYKEPVLLAEQKKPEKELHMSKAPATYRSF